LCYISFSNLTDVPTGTQHLILCIKQLRSHGDVHTHKLSAF